MNKLIRYPNNRIHSKEFSKTLSSELEDFVEADPDAIDAEIDVSIKNNVYHVLCSPEIFKNRNHDYSLVYPYPIHIEMKQVNVAQFQ